MAAIMFQGTGSDVGKSLIVAGLCRLFTRQGLKVRPFKPQNMSNNAAVTSDGGEIGRAQALQALACGVLAHSDMNPVLLKPQSENGAQIILQGRYYGSARAHDFQHIKSSLLPRVLESFYRLSQEADLVLVEGAGSASEVNLRANDIANMGFACAAEVPVVIIGDIDRGGVIAQLVGTKATIDAGDSERIKGFIVNRFRGDPALFQDGLHFIAQKTNWHNVGLVPFFSEAWKLPAEDAFSLQKSQLISEFPSNQKKRIVVPLLPHISNFDDFDPLKLEPSVELQFLPPGAPLPGDCDLVILPGSKATIADVKALYQQGWDIDILAHYRRNGKILGICGGYQMLGEKILDHGKMESDRNEIAGLNLLPFHTHIGATKLLREIHGHCLASNARFSGYEMHMGVTHHLTNLSSYLQFDDGRQDGASSADGQVRGTYVHGLFGESSMRRSILSWIGAQSEGQNHHDAIQLCLDHLADHLFRHLDSGFLRHLAV